MVSFLNFYSQCKCGSDNNEYEVMLEIMDSSDNSIVVSEAATFYSKLMPYKGSSYYGFEILFDFAVYLKKTTKYRIEAKIFVLGAWVGRDGLCLVQISSVTFTFSISAVEEETEPNI